MTQPAEQLAPFSGVMFATVPRKLIFAPLVPWLGSRLDLVIWTEPSLPDGKLKDVVIPDGKVVIAVPPAATGMSIVKVPNVPVSNGDTDVDGSEVAPEFCRL